MLHPGGGGSACGSEVSAESGWYSMETPDSPDSILALMGGDGELVPEATPPELGAPTEQPRPASPYLAWAEARARLGQFVCGGSQHSTFCPEQLFSSGRESESESVCDCARCVWGSQRADGSSEDGAAGATRKM